MIERPVTHHAEAADETGERYLVNLGIDWEKLRGKKVLDIGALNAEFENAARRQGVEVISLDKEVIDGEYVPPADSRFVVATATKLPFKDGSFDFAFAHMSVMNYIEEEYEKKEGDKKENYILYIKDALREACRVLKPGGQFRFTDTALDEQELRQGEDDVVPERKSDAYDKWRMEREHQILEKLAKHVGFRELRLEKYPDSHPERDEYLLSHYYIALR